MTDVLPDPMTLAILLPLFGAIAAFLLPRGAPGIGLGTVVATAAAIAAVGHAVVQAGAVSVPLGGWGAPLGIELRADGLALAMLGLTALIALAVGLGALAAFAGKDGPADDPGAEGQPMSRQRAFFWPLCLLLLTGMNGVYLSADLFNLYVMLEVISLAAVGLAVLGGTVAALRAGLAYMYASLLGALMMLLGVGFVYLQTGRLDFAGLADAQPSVALSAAFALLLVGLALKAALFPLHFWLPEAHANATAPASALLSALVVKAGLYILLRLAEAGPFPDETLLTLLGVLGTGAVLWGGIQALRADRLKLLVAWSTVAQMGLIFIALARAGPEGLSESWRAATLLILAHGIAKAAMFLAAGRIKDVIGHDRISELDRSAVRPALAQLAFALAAISLIGLPPSLGFIGKWSLMEGAMMAGNWHWVAVTMAGTLLSVAYFTRALTGFLRFDRVRAPLDEHRGWALADAPPFALAGLAVGLGLAAGPILAVLDLGRPFGVTP
ncbi:multisubunit sodium/proton antiporter, MrpD subunit [Rhodovulum sp. ES.010]|uniref:complex I subunit 5 family protein n=1 Tax=Rhodovulum sp. ES.010 TaxID=1882821 RepID=UPI00092A6822|nr:proton-conducting transporter membrane subunit [Rhodovulum sp. ES.010]SIO54685.1 multisubunit sodium/proton antiporter, MrpD subunit [Rhodovulum sp. ES.010]